MSNGSTTAYPTTVEVPIGRIAEDGTQDFYKVAVVAQPTETPGLVITPALRSGGFSGYWALTHASSGLAVPLGWGSDDIELAHRTAKALGGTPVDWTADAEAIRSQVKEHRAAIAAARREAEYPPPAPDEAGIDPDDGPAPYPKTEAQATADAIARVVVHEAQKRASDTWDLIKRKDDDGRAIYFNNLSAFLADWGLASVLRDFAKVDQQAADYAARKVWEAWEGGDTVHELVYEWAREYGLPEVARESETAKAGA